MNKEEDVIWLVLGSTAMICAIVLLTIVTFSYTFWAAIPLALVVCLLVGFINNIAWRWRH